MKKVTEPFKMKNRDGWYIRWYENGRQKHKHFNTKKEAEHYWHFQYIKLNKDIYTSVAIPYEHAQKEYEQIIELKSSSSKHIQFVKKTISDFYDVCMPVKTDKINQKLVNHFLTWLKKQGHSNTYINNHSRVLKTFFNWMIENGYMQGTIKITKLKESPSRITALNDDHIFSLLKKAPTQEWKLRIIFNLCTGLRRADLFALLKTSVDFKNGTIGLVEQKTKKFYSCPLPDALIEPLKDYSNTVPKDREYFYRVYNRHWLDKQFRAFRPSDDITIQSLRKTFSTRVETTGISTNILNHSSKSVTRQFYNDMDYIKYIRVNQLPVKDWLEA